MAAQWLVAVKLGVELLPGIIKAVRSVEDLLPEGGKGQQKLALVMEIVQKAYETAHDAVEKFDVIRPVIEGIVASVVKFCNNVGIFKRQEG